MRTSSAARRSRTLACAGLLALGGCIAPSVVTSSGRAVAAEPATEAWREAGPADLDGLYESIRVDGPAAGAIWRLYYHFSAQDEHGGSFTGAALVVGEDGPAFQTLSGRWSLVGGLLDLGGGETPRCSVGGDRLRLETPGGTVVLQRASVN